VVKQSMSTDGKRSSARQRVRKPAGETEPPNKTRDEILAVATEEFAQHGLSGSRVDEIAERTATSKRMIYYHFKSKEGLYRAVLDQAYAGIRSRESGIDFASMTPQQAMAKLVEVTFDYDATHPQFIRLVSVENIHQAKNLRKLASFRTRNVSVLQVLESILERGRAAGIYRKDVTALDAHLMISALCFFRVSNRYTFGATFDCDLTEPAMARRHRQMIVDLVARFLEARPED
jgi:AcrR family transcriptional regulator